MCGTIIRKRGNLPFLVKIPVTIILRQEFLLLNNQAIHEMLLAISQGGTNLINITDSTLNNGVFEVSWNR